MNNYYTCEETDVGTWVRAVDGKYIMKCPFKQVIPTEDIIGITVDRKRLYFR